MTATVGQVKQDVGPSLVRRPVRLRASDPMVGLQALLKRVPVGLQPLFATLLFLGTPRLYLRLTAGIYLTALGTAPEAPHPLCCA